MKPTVQWKCAKCFALLVTLFVSSGCATNMQMPPEELKKAQPNEGIVIGSVLIKGGKDLLGRTSWNLAAKRTDNMGSEYSITAHREGNEEFFGTRMAAGDYRIYRLYQEGFSKFTAPMNVQFKVEPGKTKYLGRLVIEFPPELLTMMTKFNITIEDVRDKALAVSSGKFGLAVDDVATDLMTSQYQTSCITAPLPLGPIPLGQAGSILVAVTPSCP